ncbi:hypothetical protein COF81_06790 [Bacillus pseudomycoides]|uniref:Uncharacterized protein n=1 Tax=Bacillus pseudomycoides TaxID=64104 RepID=A0ABD6TB66_9BACI|nr:hypothetical protein CON69_11190 [Bacillus pseudomycoides]PGD74609.1 hypothetical protein COM46_20025 [Bacillus pseudomycoides]PHF02285.1 hypothetical protein COF81_06790 [Bacillus pseudomycoides]
MHCYIRLPFKNHLKRRCSLNGSHLFSHIAIYSFQFFKHISRGSEEPKVTATCFLSLFSLGTGQKKGLIASMHGQMLSST